MKTGLAVAATSVAVFAVAPGRASADLRDAAARVSDEWRAAGGSVAVGPTHFISEEETMALALPPAPERECTSVVLLGARGISFHARLVGGAAEEEEDDDEHGPRASAAGALMISRCGGSPIRRVVITSDGGRGAIEMLVGRSNSPLPPLRAILPERTGGVLPAAPEPGELPPLPPPEKRAETAEQRARRDGATIAPRDAWHAGSDGAGTGRITLDPGCHRVELFATDPRGGRGLRGGVRHGRLDLDAEMRDDTDDRLLARDRTDAADAHLEACVGEPTHTSVVFAGSPADRDVVVTRASWPIPDHLPDAWGNETRARMAAVLLARHVTGLKEDAVLLAQGGSLSTPIPASLEPGACYVAMAALVQGSAHGIGLRVEVGAREASDDRGASDEAAAVVFCARDADRALIEVDTRGSAIAWGLALIRVRGGVWLEGR